MSNKELQTLVLQKLEKLDSLEELQKSLNVKLENMDKKIDGLLEKIVDIKEFKNKVGKELEEIKRSLSKIEIITADNWGDTARLKASK